MIYWWWVQLRQDITNKQNRQKKQKQKTKNKKDKTQDFIHINDNWLLHDTGQKRPIIVILKNVILNMYVKHLNSKKKLKMLNNILNKVFSLNRIFSLRITSESDHLLSYLLNMSCLFVHILFVGKDKKYFFFDLLLNSNIYVQWSVAVSKLSSSMPSGHSKYFPPSKIILGE